MTTPTNPRTNSSSGKGFGDYHRKNPQPSTLPEKIADEIPPIAESLDEPAGNNDTYNPDLEIECSLPEPLELLPLDNSSVEDLSSPLPDTPLSKSDELVERQRKELIALAQESDRIKFNNGVADFCVRHRWSKQEVHQWIHEYKTSNTVLKAERVKGKDFLSEQIKPVSWIFPGTIPKCGLTIIGADPGGGKTTLSIHAMGSLLLNEKFLEEKPVEVGSVLLVSGDESPSYTKDKLINRGISLETENWEVLLNWDVSQFEVLIQVIEDLKPSLVIIDSFSSIHRDRNFDENGFHAKSTIYELQALIDTYEFGCILIHHLSKSKTNQGVNQVRGSSTITAAASVVILIEVMPNGTRKITFAKLRGAERSPLFVNLDPETGRYIVVSGGDDAETKDLIDLVFAELAKDPYKKKELKEILAALEVQVPGIKKNSVEKALSRLFERGRIIKSPSNRGGNFKVYGVANPSKFLPDKASDNLTDEDTPSPSELSVSVKIPESPDIQGIEVTDSLPDDQTAA